MCFPCSHYQLYNSLKAWQDDASTVSIISPVMSPIPEASQIKKVPTSSQTFRIRLPDDAVPGSSVEAVIPDGRVVTIPVPTDITPGVETYIDISISS